MTKTAIECQMSVFLLNVQNNTDEHQLVSSRSCPLTRISGTTLNKYLEFGNKIKNSFQLFVYLIDSHVDKYVPS